MAQAIKIFSKSLTSTDIKKRMAIPAKILPSLPDFNGSHAVPIQLMYGTRTWPIVCSIRKKGYKKPVFSVGWRNFVICNKFNVGDELTLYKVQDQTGSCHYRIQVEKPARLSDDISPRSFSLNHEVDDQCTDTSRMKACNFQNEKEQLLKGDAPIKHEEAIAKLASVVADEAVTFVGTNTSADQTTSNALFKTEQESKMKFFDINTKSICLGEPPFHSYYTTNEERKIKSVVLAEDGAMAYGTSQADGDAYYTSPSERLNLDLILGLPTPCTAEVNLDLTLAPLSVDGGYRYYLLTQNNCRTYDIKES